MNLLADCNFLILQQINIFFRLFAGDKLEVIRFVNKILHPKRPKLISVFFLHNPYFSNIVTIVGGGDCENTIERGAK